MTVPSSVSTSTGSDNAEHDYDVVVIGAGAAGVAAALSAAEVGARTVLVEAGPYPGGELVSGLPILGTRNTRGDRIVGGPLNTLLDGCAVLNGYVGDLFDWRTTWGTCVDPETMRLVVPQSLARAGVLLLPSSVLQTVHTHGPGQVAAVELLTSNGPQQLSGRIFVDATGSGSLTTAAGGHAVRGDAHGGFQPVSMVFRVGGVDFEPLLKFVRDHPEEFMLGQNPAIEQTQEECALQVYESGLPFVAMTAEDSDTVMATAIASGELYPTTGIWMWPTSIPRREIGFNTTRVAGIDAMDPVALGQALTTLAGQVQTAVEFVRKHLPGFANAHLAAAAPKVGIRETQRVVGERELQTEDIVSGCKHPDGIAKGGHHVDIHGAGTYQKRVPIKDGRSYDIPYGTLIPTHVANVLVCGRPLSSTRDANGSVRVMGTCIASGQAAGTAAALGAARHVTDVRTIEAAEVQAAVTTAGGVVNGTH